MSNFKRETASLRPRLRQVASYGWHTDEIGVVSKITKAGFYVRTTSRFPAVPGGRVHPSKSRFFTFEELEQGAVKLS